ncbi:Right handed beta helix region [Dyadobacter koreensis]|uniref:Right handed beta helix region n=1 Tax=Dyadobacter koreensis TaxID=408657 RepID=A0A1H6T7P2_9BACT|nr:right-handed parallel beta-helix repeat-containing protein [Dyadobacter koreensis]SEI75286.1 Right handed beta helix region [Dyadobacter koreensis]
MASSIRKFLSKIAAFFILLMITSASWAADTFFVSLSGSDTNPGTKENPFATIARAKSATRNSGRETEPSIIYVRGGTYIFQKTLEFDEGDKHLLIKPWQGESVYFTGGISVNPTKVKRLSRTEYRSEFPESLQDKIGVLNLRELEISDYGKLRSVGFARPYAPAWLEIFINNNPGRLARWPNDSTVAMGRVLDKGSVVREGDKTNRGGKFAYETSRPSGWKNSKDIWLSGYFNVGYAEDAVRIASTDTLAKTFTTGQPHIYGFASGKAWNRWYAYNIPEEIDQNGEYYLDRERGLLFFFLPSVIYKLDLSILQTPIVSIAGSENITFQGITFEVSRGIGVYMERSESCIITDCVFRNLGSVAVSIGKGIVAFDDQKHEGTGKEAPQLIGSLDQHMYENSTFEREGGKNNRIVNCHIYYTGAGGIRLGGGDRKTLTPAGNSVENCRIHDFNRIEKSYRPGVGIDGVGNSILNCEIYNAPSMAILLHGNDHSLEYNNIYDVCREVDDQGAFYYGRDPSERGNKLRFNYFHHLGNNHRTSAVYHDDGASGMEVFGNIFYKAGTIPVLIGGGQDISYKNNLFIDSPLGIHVDNRFQNWSKAALAKDGVIDKRLKAVKFEQPPYATKYAELPQYWKQDPSMPKRLYFDTNVFVKVATTRKGEDNWYNWSDNNRVLDTYPYNWKMMDSRHFIPDDSQLITPSGWQTLPVEKIGILKNYK